MGDFVVDITGLDTYAKELTTFADTLSGEASTFTWKKPNTGRWANHNTSLATAAGSTTPFQDHVSGLVTSIVTELTSHATFVGECVTAYNTSDTTASTALAFPPATYDAPKVPRPGAQRAVS